MRARRTRVKICGITRVEDAIAAVIAGVDAIGLVFYADSPRCVSVAKAVDIAAALPPFVSKVGLFVNAEEGEVSAALDAVPLDLLQFHGEESPAACRSHGLPYIKAVRMREQVNLPNVCDDYADAGALLLDSFVPERRGGSGARFDWNIVPAGLRQRLILAGGLTPANVADAIDAVAPYAVDVSSGVEAGLGIKDAAKMDTFIREVARADR